MEYPFVSVHVTPADGYWRRRKYAPISRVKVGDVTFWVCEGNVLRVNMDDGKTSIDYYYDSPYIKTAFPDIKSDDARVEQRELRFHLMRLLHEQATKVGNKFLDRQLLDPL